jgi:hypothetical protein
VRHTIKRLSAIGLLLHLLLSLPLAARASEWIQYGASPSGSMQYYDEAGLTVLPDGSVRVLVKMVFSDEEIRRYLQYRKQGNLPMDGYENLKYAELLRQIHCQKKEITTIIVKEYSGDGKALSSFNIDQTRVPFTPIEPGSIDETLYRTVCAKARKQ